MKNLLNHIANHTIAELDTLADRWSTQERATADFRHWCTGLLFALLFYIGLSLVFQGPRSPVTADQAYHDILWLLAFLVVLDVSIILAKSIYRCCKKGLNP